MKKYLFAIILAIIVIAIGFRFYFRASGHYDICLKDKFIITNVTDTIQTISFTSQNYNNGKIRLIRGKIEGYKVIDDFLVGYLNISFFAKDDIAQFAGENDKEGYFIIDFTKKTVVSGLSQDEYKQFLKSSLKLTEIPKLKKISPYSRINCWLSK